MADTSEHNPYTEEGMREKATYETDTDLVALREYNDLVRNDERLETFLLPLWDGVSLARLTN